MRLSILNFLFVFILSNPMVFCQKMGLGFGFEINQTRFRQYAPTVNVPFENPHEADFGMGVYVSFYHKLSKKFIINLRPEIAFVRTKSSVTSANQMNYLLFDAEIGYFLNYRNRLNLSVGYSYLAGLLKAYNSPFSNFTFFANHRHAINPNISFEHYWSKNWSTHFKFTYFTKDVFNSGALDADKNIVGPVKVTPYTFALGLNYYYPFKSKKNKKEAIREGNRRIIKTN
jgi:hypothetical protein